MDISNNVKHKCCRKFNFDHKNIGLIEFQATVFTLYVSQIRVCRSLRGDTTAILNLKYWGTIEQTWNIIVGVVRAGGPLCCLYNRRLSILSYRGRCGRLVSKASLFCGAGSSCDNRFTLIVTLWLWTGRSNGKVSSH